MLARSLNRRVFTATAATAVATSGLVSAIRAQDATPQAETSAADPSGVESEVLLTGLADPRFVVVDGGDVYFTEAGTGGEEEIFLPDNDESPISMAGHTGRVSRLSADGTLTEIANDLMSYTFGAAGEIVGPAGLALDGAGSIYVAIGAPGPFIETMPRTGDEGVLLKIDLETGETTVLADLIDWEINQNPDPIAIDSNPYGISLMDGMVYVADAGGNSIIAVDAETGAISTFAVTGGVPAEFFGADGNPARDGAAEIDSVPSAVEPGPDGRLYVAYITGGPFPVGHAPVDAFSTDGNMERVVEGLTMTADIAFDSSGAMYAAIASTDLINGGPGQIVRIDEDGSFYVVIDGLALPAGIAFDADDNLYVINKSSTISGGGELIRYSGIVTATDVSVEEHPTSEATTVEDGSGASGHTFHVDFVDMAFEPSEFTIPADTDVTLTFENKGFLAHDFVIANPKMVSEVLANGGTSEMVVNLPAGTYEFYCAQIGHRAAGMQGTMTVE